MAISDSFLQELKYRCDIESVVSRYVNLRKSGRDFVGLCPFHSEKTPSFHVSAENQMFYCFGCETGGDVITFIEKIENLDYREAIYLLAKQAGMEVPEENEDAGAARLKARILEMNRLAALFFHRSLTFPAGKEGLAYFGQRQLSPATVRAFGLGYAPETGRALFGHLTEAGYSPDEIVAAGLAGQRQGRNEYYDMFRRRVMFPIIDLRGNVIAFGGRVLGDGNPKYLNSRDTPVFSKSRTLFALNFAKNSGSDTLILCEGYMDAIALHQAGFKHAVATLGTALTAEQSRLMARYAKEVVISYDSDQAGQNAAQRAIGLLTAAGLSVRVLRIEGGKDPDEYIKTHGADSFRRMLEKSGNHIEYRLNSALSKYDVGITEQLAAYLKEAAQILATVESSIERDVYAGRLSEKLGVSKENILEDVRRLAGKKGRADKRERIREEINASIGYKDRLNPEKSRYLLAARAEENLNVLLFKNPDFIPEAKKRITPDDFVTAFNKRVFEALCTHPESGESGDISRLGELFTPEETGKISFLFLTRQVSNTIEELRDCCEVIREEKTRKDGRENAVELFNAIRKKQLEEKKTGGNNL